MTIRPLFFAMLASLSLLMACDSAEDRAEQRYQSALALIEEGDFDRAIVELRSVFDLNGSHLEARRALANLLLTHKNNIRGAYGQYLRLAEQFPDDLDARIALSELAFSTANWDELERHGQQAEELAPDNPRVKAITAARGYRTAVLDEDNAARREQARVALAALDEFPDNEMLRNIKIDNLMREGEFRSAMMEIDWLLERRPRTMRFWRMRLNALAQLQDFEGMEEQLRRMVDQFPDDDSHKTTLIRFYMSREQPDDAETFLRELAAATDDIGPRADLIRFLLEVRGPDAAQTEVAQAITERPEELSFKALAASIDFSQGETDRAISTLHDALEGAEPGDDVNQFKVVLARMLLSTGNEIGARARVEEVLQANPDHPEALKMQAGWLIEADEVNDAIAGLRVALDQNPDDSAAMTLMANAYTRLGRSELARDFLALAVDASGNAPEETLRYSQLLINEENYRAAEDILLPALRLAPNDVRLMNMLGRLYLAMGDNGRLDQVIRALQSQDSDQAKQLANGLQAELINRQSGPQDALRYLEDLADADDTGLNASIALVRARLATGDADGALQIARTLQDDNPDDERLQAMRASVEAVNGNLSQAEEIYLALLKSNPNRPAIWLELSRVKSRQNDFSSAQEVISQGLEANPTDVNLLWARASLLENEGDIDGAIDIYQTLYERNSSSLVIANNLASLLSTHRTSEEDLERAWVIARRLNDTQVPALQDTYGWIAHRRGDSEAALPYLEGAAAGLPGDPIVQYHLAKVYAALGRDSDALRQFQIALNQASPSDQRPQIQDARDQVAALEAAAQAAEENTVSQD